MVINCNSPHLSPSFGLILLHSFISAFLRPITKSPLFAFTHTLSLSLSFSPFSLPFFLLLPSFSLTKTLFPWNSLCCLQIRKSQTLLGLPHITPLKTPKIPPITPQLHPKLTLTYTASFVFIWSSTSLNPTIGTININCRSWIRHQEEAGQVHLNQTAQQLYM